MLSIYRECDWEIVFGTTLAPDASFEIRGALDERLYVFLEGNRLFVRSRSNSAVCTVREFEAWALSGIADASGF